jgi:t-SNARE complex subunit (syntaxin)
VHVADIPDELIKLERSAEEERAKLAGLMGEEYEAQWRRWREASEAAQAAITAHVQEFGENRYELEQAVKKAVRHAEEDPAD